MPGPTPMDGDLDEGVIRFERVVACTLGEGGQVPPEDQPTVAAHFDAVYGSIAHTPTRVRIQREAYGDEYPAELEPFGLVTWSELRRIARELNVGLGQHVVDLGCGEGGVGLWLASETGASMTGIDISSVAVRRAAERVADAGLLGRAHFEVGDIAATRLPAQCFDGAVSVDTMWMMPDKIAVFRETARILRPEARLLMTTWDFPVTMANDGYVVDHRPALIAAGFEVEAYEAIDGWEEQFRALLAGYEAARQDLVREFGEETAENLIEFERRRASLLPEWKRVYVRARRR